MSIPADHALATPEPLSVAVSPVGPSRPAGGRWARAALWLPGFAVAIGAAVATAHGLYEVAAASRVPAAIAWLYPLITDGLALVAYIATARLSGSAARYAWSVVILAAGLSGLAQAAFLAGEAEALDAPPWLRFGIGAWPAVAAAIVAHLLYLLAAESTAEPTPRPHPIPVDADVPEWAALRSTPVAVQRAHAPVVQARVFTDSYSPPAIATPDPAGDTGDVQPVRERSAPDPRSAAGERDRPEPARPSAARGPVAPARERAVAAAARHAETTGSLPTVTELEALAGVSRGTASSALKHLRDTEPQPAEHDSEATQP